MQAIRRLRIRVRTGDRPAKDHEVGKTVIRVGSHPNTDIVVDDPTVSRIHLEIVADDHGFRMRDLGSTNGSYVDGCRAADVYLRSGARIEIGETELTIEPLA